MNVNKLITQAAQNVADTVSKKVSTAASDADVREEVKVVEHCASDIAGNYGKATAQLSSNTTPVVKPAQDAAEKVTELDKIFAQMEAKGKQVIKIENEKDELEVLLYRGKDTDYFKARDGKAYRVRYSRDDELNKTLIEVRNAYAARGIQVPQMMTVTINGKRGVASQVLTELQPKENDPKNVYDLFATDVLFGNRNAFRKGTTMLNSDGEPVRVTTSGCAGYRVRGERRYDFTEELTELRTFLDPRVNPESAEFLKDMTREDLLKSIQRATKTHTPWDIPTREILSKRYNNLKEFWIRAELMPQKEGESLLDYVTRVQNKIAEVHQQNSYYTQRLLEIAEGYEIDGKYSWQGGFTEGDKETIKKFIDLASTCNDVPKALYERRLSRDEMLKLAQMQFEKHDSNRTTPYISITDEPEIFSRVLYSPYKTEQTSFGDLANFSNSYPSMRVNYGSGEAGGRTIIEKGLLDKFYKGEMSFEDFSSLGLIELQKWSKLEDRKLLEPLPGMDKPVSKRLLSTLLNLKDENFEKMLTRTEVLKDMPYRSEPINSEIIWKISELSDEQYQRLLKYHILEDKYPNDAKILFDKLSIEAIAKMSDEEIETAISRGLFKHRKELEPKGFANWNSQLGGYEIATLSRLSDKEFDNLVRRGLFSGKFDYFAREKLYKTADLSEYDLEILKLYGIDADLKHDSYSPEQLRRIIALPNKSRIRELERINPIDPSGRKSFGTHDKLLSKESIVKFAELPDKAYERAISIIKNEKLLNGPFKDGGVYEAALCDDTIWQTIQRRGLLDVDNPPFANMRDLLRGYIRSDLAKDLTDHESAMTLLARIPDEKWELFKRKGLLTTDPKKGQFCGTDIYEFSKYSDEELDKLFRTKILESEYIPAEHQGYCFSGYHSTYHLKRIVQELTADEIDALAKRDFFIISKENSYGPNYASSEVSSMKKLAHASSEIFENYQKLLEKGDKMDVWLAIEAATRFTSKTEIQRILDRNLLGYSRYFDGDESGAAKLKNLAELVKLTDREWKFVRPLMHQGIGVCHYLHIAVAINPGKGVAHLVDFVNGRKNIYDFSFRERRQLLNHLVHTGRAECSDDLIKLIPENTIIPRTYYRRRLLIDELTQSIGLSSKKLSDVEIADFKQALGKLSEKDSGIMATDFNKMSTKLINPAPLPRLLYSREKFANDVFDKIKDLPVIEQKKIFDYFSFDLEKGVFGEPKLVGYPDPAGKNLKFTDLDSEETKQAIERLRPYVEKFTNGNKIFVEGNPKLEAELNKILNVFPEFATVIGKVQHHTHDFTVDVHILKVLQGVMSDSRYANLSDNDKIIMQISTILHDLTKAEGLVDKAHPADSAFDAYYIVNRLKLPREDKLKIYEIIKNHDWLEKLNKPIRISPTEYRKLTPEEYKDRLQKIAFAHRQNDCFEMASILTKADLKGVDAQEKFYTQFKTDYEEKMTDVKKLIDKIKSTAISIPQTRIPKADELIVDGDIVKEVTKDGITNRVIYLRPGQDLSKVGFDKGVTSDEFNAIVHALDYEEQATVFRALGIVDSDALLSASWVNKGKGNYKVFRGQGYILKVDCDDIHAGLPVDFGSGYKKDYDTLLNEYLFGYERSNVRKYWSDEVKKKFELDDEGYKKFNERIKNKSFNQIKSEEPETARKIQEIIDDMEVKRRAGGRNYNEWLVSRPEIQGGFFWGKNPNTGKTKTISDVPLFIREYLAEHNLPLIFLGE
ncbi:MAG: hypothetical protein ACI37Q_06375 [Candidatus Gastranaerophilaceae bacterium]